MWVFAVLLFVAPKAQDRVLPPRSGFRADFVATCRFFPADRFFVAARFFAVFPPRLVPRAIRFAATRDPTCSTMMVTECDGCAAWCWDFAVSATFGSGEKEDRLRPSVTQRARVRGMDRYLREKLIGNDTRSPSWLRSQTLSGDGSASAMSLRL